MTKQEYEIEFKKSNNMIGDVCICIKYINSLEAENAEKERALEIACNKLGMLCCPLNANPLGEQPCDDSEDCATCWRKYLTEDK